jgi:catechol 2,3-dioxygenase-like lactoylglutathione lyase family enzyme
MIDHVTLHVSDIEASKEFFAKALKPLDYSLKMEFPEYKIAGFAWEGKPDFWLNGSGTSQTTHVAFLARDKVIVDEFYKSGLAAGGKDNGKPGYRKNYSPGYYAAFVLDPDGHNIEVVFHDPTKKS